MALPEGANSTSLLAPARFKCSGREGVALDLRATSMKSPRVVVLGWWPPFPGRG